MTKEQKIYIDNMTQWNLFEYLKYIPKEKEEAIDYAIALAKPPILLVLISHYISYTITISAWERIRGNITKDELLFIICNCRVNEVADEALSKIDDMSSFEITTILKTASNSIAFKVWELYKDKLPVYEVKELTSLHLEPNDKVERGAMMMMQEYSLNWEPHFKDL